MPNYQDIIKLTETILAKRDPYNHHGTRVSLLTRRMAQCLELSEHEIEMMEYAGALHDVGKLVIAEDVVSLPRKLTVSERNMIASHCIDGYHILQELGCDPIILDATLHHHENWNGSGYPDRLHGENISIYARILKITDTYDAMITKRSYRTEITKEKTKEEMEKLSGLWFDPDLLKIFFEKVVHGNG